MSAHAWNGAGRCVHCGAAEAWAEDGAPIVAAACPVAALGVAASYETTPEEVLRKRDAARARLERRRARKVAA